MNEYDILQLKKLKAKQTFLESVHEEKNYIFQSKAVPLFHKDFSEIIPKPEKQKFKNERKKTFSFHKQPNYLFLLMCSFWFLILLQQFLNFLFSFL